MSFRFGAALLVVATMPCAAARAATVPPFEVKVSGHGPAMILIPGLSSSGEVWDATVQKLAPRYQCHVLTLAGFAGVKPIDGPLLPRVEEELVRYIDRRHLGRPIIVGHSLGGFVALRLAAEHPDRVGKLVIVDSLPALGAVQVPTMTAAQLQAMAARLRDGMLAQDAATVARMRCAFVSGMATQPEDVERIVAWGERSDRKTEIAAMYELMATDLRGPLQRITAPTLVLGSWIAYKDMATEDSVAQTYREQYAKLPHVKIEMAARARHFIMYDQPEWFLARVQAFLE